MKHTKEELQKSIEIHLPAFLDAATGIHLGGTFFKVGDKVSVDGEGINRHTRMYADGIIEYIEPERHTIGIKVRPDWILMFDYKCINSIKRITEDK